MFEIIKGETLRSYQKNIRAYHDSLTEHAQDLRESWIQQVWLGWIVPIFHLLALIRFSVLVAVVCIYILIFNDQGQEVLRALVENGDPVQIVCFVLAATLCAVVAWYWARVSFFYSFNGSDGLDPREHPRIREHLPRLIGATVFFAIAIAFFKASLAYASLFSGPSAWSWGLVAIFVVLGVLFYPFAHHLRAWFKLRDKDRPSDPDYIEHLPKKTRPFLILGLIITVGLILVFAYYATDVAPLLGTGTIFLLFAAALIPNGTFLVLYFGTRRRLPVIGFMLVWAVGLSFFVDNHRVRQSAEMRSYDDFKPPASQPRALHSFNSIEDYYDKWIAGLEKIHANDPAIPVIVVSAEGGGIRAAYWTAQVLGWLQDRARESDIDFARHVFAVSGVSGGSLGAATFAALVSSDARAAEPKISHGCGAVDKKNRLSKRHRAHRILARDFLSPTVAVMLFPDFYQRFVPWPRVDDRAMALERSWEAAWRECEKNDLFADPFTSLWSGAKAEDASDRYSFEVPLLFLNSTVVDSGKRMIATPIPFERSAFDSTFSDALETTRVLGHDIPLSTAVHTSARFTYVSPAGTVRRLDLGPDAENAQRWIRVVDGGYFENSGAVTAEEILTAIERAALRRSDLQRAKGEIPKPILPVVVHISNEPLKRFDASWIRQWSKGAFFAEVGSPVEALLNVRPARGSQARTGLANYVQGPPEDQGSRESDRAAIKRPGIHLHFLLCEYDVPLPLGWVLSEDSQSEMQAQLSDHLGNKLGRESRKVAGYHDNLIERLASALEYGNDLPAEQHLQVTDHDECKAPAKAHSDGIMAAAG